MTHRKMVLLAAMGIAILGGVAAAVLNAVDASGSVSALVVIVLALVAGEVAYLLVEHDPRYRKPH